jgi:hypothetical protein
MPPTYTPPPDPPPAAAAVPSPTTALADARRLGRQKLAARRKRTSQIRTTVAGAAVTVFVASFSTIYVQLASGNDPALTSSKATSATSATVVGKSTTAATRTPAVTSTPSTAASSPAAPAAVTTHQS